MKRSFDQFIIYEMQHVIDVWSIRMISSMIQNWLSGFVFQAQTPIECTPAEQYDPEQKVEAWRES